MAVDPLHGVTLKHMVQHLYAEYGWDGLAERVPVKCFQSNPSLKSSLKFLRRTEWARARIEQAYLQLWAQEESNPAISDLKRGEIPVIEGLSQARLHEALAWGLRHWLEVGKAAYDLNAELSSTEPTAEAHAQALLIALTPLLSTVQDLNFWPDTQPMPLLNQAVESEAPPALLRELLRYGVDVNDARYWLPLLHTVDVEGRAYRSQQRAPNTALLDLFLAQGADPSNTDAQGRTALDIAEMYDLKAAIHKLEI